MDKLLNLKNLNAEDYNSVDVCAYLRKSNSKTQQLKTKGEEISDILLHASRQYSRWRYYLKQNPVATRVTAEMSEPSPVKKEKPKAAAANVSDKKIIKLLSPAERVLYNAFKRNTRKGLPVTDEMRAASKLYSKVRRQEKKKQTQTSVVTVHEPVVTVREPVATIYKGLQRNGLSLIQAYDSDDDDDEIFNKEWDPTTIVERLQNL
jgi:hypothetical protein